MLKVTGVLGKRGWIQTATPLLEVFKISKKGYALKNTNKLLLQKEICENEMKIAYEHFSTVLSKHKQ